MDTDFVHALEENRATERYHGEFAKLFLSAVPVVALGSFICIENALHNLRIYRGKCARNKSSGVPSEAAAGDLDAVHGGDRDDCNWVGADIDSSIGNAAASRAVR